MRTETVQVKLAKSQVIEAVKSTIDYKRLKMREIMIINSYIEATINNLIRKLSDMVMTGV